MAKYRVKTDDVDAIEFTPELGAEVIAATQENEKLVKAGNGPGVAHKTGITFQEGHGYRYGGYTLSFGDFLVTSHGATCVMDRASFTDRYEAKSK